MGRISVTPGEQFSLQYHHHRSEHWVVTAGQPTVTVGDTGHPVEIIEVQIGAYLGGDDIVRLEDRYSRAPEELSRTA